MSKADTLLFRANRYTVVPFDYPALSDSTLESKARDAADKIRELQRGAVLDIGRELLSMKAALPHGKFDEWVEAEFNWSKSTALNYMRVASEFGDKYATVAYLPPSVVYQLASPSTPPVVREAVMQVQDGQQISAASVKSMIKEARTIEQSKERRAWRKEQKEQEAAEDAKTGLTRQQRSQAEWDRERDDANAADSKAVEAADRLRFMLGGYYPEFRELIKTVDTYRFTRALDNMIKQDEAH